MVREGKGGMVREGMGGMVREGMVREGVPREQEKKSI